MVSKKESGDNFEIRIESIYQGLGFKTTRNVSAFGQQVDIVAIKSLKGLGEIHLLIECKYRSKGSVSNQEVINYQNYLNTLKEKYSYTKGVMITNTDFSKDAKLIPNENLVLITVTDLENEYFELKENYIRFCKIYEAEEIFNNYIPLSAHTSGKSIINVEDYIFNSIMNKPYNKSSAFFSLLGDYGSGKSTLERRLFYRFSKSYLDNKSSIKPFYLELKEYNKFKNIELFITASYQKAFQKEIDFKTFYRELSNQGFILLLDGFDEMSQQVDKEKRLEDFKILAKLIFSNSHCVLSCRPSYFVTLQEYNSFINYDIYNGYTQIIDENSTKLSGRVRQENINKAFNRLKNIYIDKNDIIKPEEKDVQTINLQELSSSQILLYLSKFELQFNKICQATSSQIENFLADIYDLSELMTKPLLLSMIKDTVLGHGINYKVFRSDYGPAYLYEIYTEINLELEWSKGNTRQFLTKSERKEFAIAIALSMFESSSWEVEYKTIASVVSTYKKNLLKLDKRLASSNIESISSDIQICTFITRTDYGTFKFIHTSFMEFFIAKYLVEKFEAGIIDNKLKEVPLKSEILLFFGSYCLNKQNLIQEVMKYLKVCLSDIEKRNFAIILLNSKPEHENFELHYINIYEASFSKIKFTSSTINTVTFNKIRFKRITFKDAIFNNVTIFESKLFNFEIFDSKGTICIEGTKVEDINISNSNRDNILNFEWSSTDFSKVKFQKLNLQIKHCSFSFSEALIFKCNLHFIPIKTKNKRRETIILQKVNITSSEISGTLLKLVGNVELNNCVVSNFNISGLSEPFLITIKGGKIEKGNFRNCEIILDNVVLVNVSFDDCTIITTAVNNFNFDSCTFQNVTFNKNDGQLNGQFDNCNFKTTTINLLGVASLNHNIFDSYSKGIFISGKNSVLSQPTIKKSKKTKFLLELSTTLFIIKEDDYKINRKGVVDKLLSIGIFN